MAEHVTRPNASFRAALEKVIDGERVILATALGQIRVAMALVAAAAAVVHLLGAEWRTYLPSTLGSILYFVAAIVIWRLLKTGKLVKRAGWMLPIVDMPLIAVAQLIQTARLPVPLVGMVNTPAMMLGLVVFSVLSLSRKVIVITSLMGLVPLLYRIAYVSLPINAAVLILVAHVGVTMVMLALVGRMRGLVHTSRAQDLLGKYVLGRRIGLGGMAEVFEATYSPEGGFERRVAVKRILSNFADHEVARALFRQEAQVGAMLAHPGVVQVLDYGKHQGTSFLAMEYVDGVSLKDLINFERVDNGRLPILVVTHIAWQVAEALDYIHNRESQTGAPLNLVHRDLNPPNIMITRNGDAKLADFGIALIQGQERMTAAGVMRGKVGYAAPEQILGTEFDRRADLFALGVTMHECLTGVRVFRAERDHELMKQVLEGPVDLPSSLRPEVPPALDEIVMGLLQRDPTRRTPSADALRRALGELPQGVHDSPKGRKLTAAVVSKTQAWLAPSAISAFDHTSKTQEVDVAP